MKITQLEQSGFILETDNGYRLAVDIGAYTPLEKLDDLQVDALLISHVHGDHFSIEHIKKLAPKKVYFNQECIDVLGEEALASEIVKVGVGDTVSSEGVTVHFFDVDHGPNVSVRPKENFGFLIEADGKKVYFAGDMFYPSGMEVADLAVDIALIPVGSYYTFGPEEALSFIKQFRSIDQVLPMHYEKTPERREVFVKLAEAGGVTIGHRLGEFQAKHTN